MRISDWSSDVCSSDLIPTEPHGGDAVTGPRTLYDKIWDAHAVAEADGETLLYIDLHLLHEVTSPQAFAGLAEAGRAVRWPERAPALSDHTVPTAGQQAGRDRKGVGEGERVCGRVDFSGWR